MNALTISQTKEQTDLAVSVHQNAQIVDVRLARAKFAADRPAIALREPIEVSMDFKAKRIEDTPAQLVVEVSFRLTGLKKQNPSKSRTTVCIECTFEMSYELKAGFNPTPEQVSAFKDGNAIFNCWPYCRQYVQETIQRMGYPPLILPFLRVQTKTSHQGRKLQKPE